MLRCCCEGPEARVPVLHAKFRSFLVKACQAAGTTRRAQTMGAFAAIVTRCWVWVAWWVLHALVTRLALQPEHKIAVRRMSMIELVRTACRALLG